jgi:hypothetical protein
MKYLLIKPHYIEKEVKSDSKRAKFSRANKILIEDKKSMKNY